jgi:tetratricopeptide (TPR) repeat protein
LSSLADQYQRLGRTDKAIAASKDALDMCRSQPSGSDPSILGRTARTLSALGTQLAKLGRHEDAVGASKQAVETYQGLTTQEPAKRAAVLPSLAAALNNLGAVLSVAGRHEDAVLASKQAVETYQGLATQETAKRAAVLPSLAAALNNLGAVLSVAGRRKEALEATEASVVTYQALANETPETFAVPLARALNNMSVDLLLNGEAQQALEVIERVVAAPPTPGKRQILPDLGAILSNLAEARAAGGLHEKALEASDRAVGVYRDLANEKPDAYQPVLASALDNLAGHLEDNHRTEEAIARTEEAVQILERLPDAPAAAKAHAVTRTNFALRLARAGHKKRAIVESEKAVLLSRQQAPTGAPALVLGTALANMSTIYKEVGRHEDAAAVAHEAEALRHAQEAEKPPGNAFTLSHTSPDVDVAYQRSLSRAGNALRSVVLSADGRWLSAAGTDRFVHLYSGLTGAEFSGKHFPTFSTHHDEVIAMAVTPDGKRLVSLGGDNFVKLWDLVSMDYIDRLRAADISPRRYRHLAIAGSGAIVAVAGDDTQIWDVSRKKPRSIQTGPVRSLCFTPDASKLLLATEDGELRAWNIEAQAFAQLPGTISERVSSVAALDDGLRFAAGTETGAIIVAPLDGGPAIHFTCHESSVAALALSTAHVLSSAKDGTACLSKLDGTLVAKWRASPDFVGVGLSRDSSRIILADEERVELWRVRERQPRPRA